MVRRFAALAILLGLASPPAWATDPQDLDLFLPNTLEDAFAGEPDGYEAQFAARYDRRRGHDEIRLRPILQSTPLDGLQLNLTLPYTVGSGPQANQGDLGAGIFYNLNREGPWLPAFALAIDASTPVGPGDRATELQLTGVATRSLDPRGVNRVHLNLTWTRRFAPSLDERTIGYRAAVGYSRLLNENAVLIVDLLRQRQEIGAHDSHIVEVGTRLRLSPGVTIGLGVGAGIGRDSPRFRALASLEFDL